MLPALRYVVPVHNDESILADAVDTLTRELSRRPGTGPHHVLLVENGSRDRSYEVARGLAGERRGVMVHAFTEPNAGIGYGYDRGMREALALGGPHDASWVVLTASDLPFDFSDLDSFERWYERTPHGRMAIGSKAHPDSRTSPTLTRALATRAYRAARRVVVGMRTGDSQGSFFLREDLVQGLLPRIRSRDFFYTTELVHLAERDRESIAEVPIRVGAVRRESTVHPFRDGRRMFLALLELRRRMR